MAVGRITADATWRADDAPGFYFAFWYDVKQEAHCVNGFVTIVR